MRPKQEPVPDEGDDGMAFIARPFDNAPQVACGRSRARAVLILVAVFLLGFLTATTVWFFRLNAVAGNVTIRDHGGK